MSELLRYLFARFSLKAKGKTCCALVALITALAFITLVSTSVSHVHQSSQETQDCSLCSVVTDKIGGGFSATALVLTRYVVLFAIAALTLRSSLHATARLLPRSCGPPSAR